MSNSVSNTLLGAIPASCRARLLARLKPVPLPAKTILYQPNVSPTHAHFMTSGAVSEVIVMADGSSAEVGIWGREGLMESLHLLGNSGVPTRCFVQVGGTALRMLFGELQEEFLNCRELRESILQYVQVRSAIRSQLAGCNRLHETEARLARWLLMVRDETESDSFLVTQEILATMLGARRTTVTEAASNLKQKKLITYTRGNLQITNSEELEQTACECYGAVRQLLKGLYREQTETLAGEGEGTNG